MSSPRFRLELKLKVTINLLEAKQLHRRGRRHDEPGTRGGFELDGVNRPVEEGLGAGKICTANYFIANQEVVGAGGQVRAAAPRCDVEVGEIGGIFMVGFKSLLSGG